MEAAMDNLIRYPNNQDYCEIFYRAEYVKVFDLNIHKIMKMPENDVFYLQ